MEAAEYHTSLASWAEQDRPREKLLLKGVSALSDAELLAVLLRSGTRNLNAVDLAKAVLRQIGNDIHELAKMSVGDLMKFRGIGEAKAIAIVSALELGRRRTEVDSRQKPAITRSADAYALMKPELLDKKKEEFWVILLNRANRVIGKIPVSSGGVSGTVADPKLIFKPALDLLASSVILVHNHPSGNLKPSDADIKLTRKLKAAGEMLEITVLDHLIFADESYYSFADEGMM
jgi:DNA repair protein RadC